MRKIPYREIVFAGPYGVYLDVGANCRNYSILPKEKKLRRGGRCPHYTMGDAQFLLISHNQKTRSSCWSISIVVESCQVCDGFLFARTKQELVHSASPKRHNITATSKVLFWHLVSRIKQSYFGAYSLFPASAIALLLAMPIQRQ